MRIYSTTVMIALTLSLIACEGEISNAEMHVSEKTQDDKVLQRKHAEKLLASLDEMSSRSLHSFDITKYEDDNTRDDNRFETVKNCFLETGLLSKEDYEKNKKYIFTDEGKSEGLSVSCIVPCKFQFKRENPAKLTKIEVTGIKDLPGSGECGTHKYVEFSSLYEGLSDKLNKCIQPGGKAAFALYDDGWRVDQVAFNLQLK